EVEDGEFGAQVEGVVVGDFGDEDLDEDLWHGSVQGLEDLLHALLVLGGGGDEQGVGVGVGDDVNLSGELGDGGAGAADAAAAAESAAVAAEVVAPEPAAAEPAAPKPAAAEA